MNSAIIIGVENIFNTILFKTKIDLTCIYYMYINVLCVNKYINKYALLLSDWQKERKTNGLEIV